MTSGAPTDGAPAQPGDDVGVLAEQVAATALAVPGVARLHAGAFGEAGTYLPGRRIDGVRLRDNGVEVHIVTAWEANVLETADAVRAAVGGLPGLRDAGPQPVDVVVQDVAAPEELVGAHPERQDP